ncbi:MAG: hypothetical protein AUF76_13160 [Acidobacteria bacterium 13_1_20CM_2_65_9]|nr:MAG: hypothetical protein AUF76_13160 [Acidobacteria bacterium 13_1_20CM_2_65_9]
MRCRARQTLGRVIWHTLTASMHGTTSLTDMNVRSRQDVQRLTRMSRAGMAERVSTSAVYGSRRRNVSYPM